MGHSAIDERRRDALSRMLEAHGYPTAAKVVRSGIDGFVDVPNTLKLDERIDEAVTAIRDLEGPIVLIVNAPPYS